MNTSDGGLTNAERQAHEERQIFELFAEYTHLPVIADSIQSLSPLAPDILCTMNDGRKVAFELGELSDESFRQASETLMQSRDLLRRGFRSLPPDYQRQLLQHYASAMISVHFSPEANLRRRAAVLPALYEWMVKYRPEEETVGSALPSSAKRVVEKLVISRPYPCFSIEPGLSMRVASPTMRIVDKKVKATYDTEYPIELLLHMSLPVLPLVDWLQKHEQLLHTSLQGSVFRRAWVFSPAERATDQAVKLIYP